MTDEPSKESRPPDQAEPADPDVPQDPGIPGRKAEDEQTEGAPTRQGHGFPGSDDERAKREAAEADDTLAPGSMPPDVEEQS